MVTGISAVTLATHDMARAVRFYRMLGFEIIHGGEMASFTSFRIGGDFLNLILQPAEKQWSWWGRLSFYDDGVDGLDQRVAPPGCRPEAPPRAAPGGERLSHITDPDGHALSLPWPFTH